MENRQRFRGPFMWLMAAIGSLICFFSLSHFSSFHLDFLLLLVIYALISSHIAIKIPRLNGQITVADTIIFLALFLYGRDAAVLLAWMEGPCSAWRGYRKLRTILFNAGITAFSTFISGWAVERCFGPLTALPQGGFSATFVTAIGLMALVQYVANTSLAAISSACQIN